MTSSHPFDPFKTSTPLNDLNASMWAPKQQTVRAELDNAWHAGQLGLFDGGGSFRQRVEGLCIQHLHAPGHGRQNDVFEDLASMGPIPVKQVGTIGDERMNPPRPDFPDAVRQRRIYACVLALITLSCIISTWSNYSVHSISTRRRRPRSLLIFP
jgi:hypothetical protein